MTLTSLQHRWIYLAGLALVAVGLPVSKALISTGEIILALNFLLEGRFRERLAEFGKRPSMWFFTGFFLLHAVGLLWTSDFDYALRDIKIKLPLLLFPIVIPLSQRLTRSEFLWIAALFSAMVILTSFFSTWRYFSLKGDPATDFRDISLFTSHIRYSLMVCLSYIILLNCAWNEEKQLWLRVVYVLLATWMGIFIFILQSMTGIVVWFFCSYMLLFYTLFHTKAETMRIAGLTVLFIAPVVVGSYLLFHIDAFYPDRQPDFSSLETHTHSGEVYLHDTNNLALENGNYINLYIAPGELERAWKMRSEIPYQEGRDQRGQLVYSTLIRYLTSKGLRKDSAGVMALTDEDVAAIESGIANVRFTYGNPIDNRIYTVIWEFDKMMNDKRVQGHSVTQRLEFWNTGRHIFEEHWIIGVGTGDVNQEFVSMYDKLDSALGEEYRLRAHNQFLTVAITFGIIGLIVFLLSIVYPFLRLKNANSFLYIGFAIILYSSMLNEDTLETQMGVTLYAFFNAFLLYALTPLSPGEDKTAS